MATINGQRKQKREEAVVCGLLGNDLFPFYIVYVYVRAALSAPIENKIIYIKKKKKNSHFHQMRAKECDAGLYARGATRWGERRAHKEEYIKPALAIAAGDGACSFALYCPPTRIHANLIREARVDNVGIRRSVARAQDKTKLIYLSSLSLSPPSHRRIYTTTATSSTIRPSLSCATVFTHYAPLRQFIWFYRAIIHLHAKGEVFILIYTASWCIHELFQETVAVRWMLNESIRLAPFAKAFITLFNMFFYFPFV